MSEQIATHALRYTWLEPKESRWTTDDFDKLRAAWKDATILRADLPRHVGRTEEACSRMARLLGLGPRPKAAAKAATHVWTAEQVEALMRLWPNVQAIYEATGRGFSAIEKKAWQQGLPPKSGYPKGPLPFVKRDAKAEQRLVIRHEPPGLVDRKCLDCGRPFKAVGRFIRLCGPCKGHRG